MEDFFKAVNFRLCVVMFNRMMFLKCLRSSENWVNLCRTEIHQYWRSPHWATRNVSTYSRFILFYNFSFGLWYNNTGAIDVKMDGSVFQKKSSFKMLWLTFSSKLDGGSYIFSVAKTASKEIRASIRSVKFFFSWGCSVSL